MSYEICFNAHNYWLSTIREFIIPVELMENLPIPYKEFIQKGILHQQKGEIDLARSCYQQAQQIASIELDRGLILHINAIIDISVGKGDFAKIEQGFQQCLTLAPNCPHYHYNLGLFYLRTRQSSEDIVKAINSFNQAVAYLPTFGQAYAALALIHTLSRHWDEALKATRKALSLNAQIGNRLIDLCLMNATYQLGQPIEGAFNFDSVQLNAIEHIDAALAFLPPVDLAQFKHPEHQQMLFIACDNKYFLEYTVPLIWSLAEIQTRCAIHIHVFNPEPPLKDAVELIRTKIAPIALYVSYEQVELEKYAAPSIYFSTVRYCRFYQLSTVNPETTLILVDADAIFRQPPDTIINSMENDTHVGLNYSENEPMWDQIVANLIYCKSTENANRFLSQVALFIIDNLRKKTGRWFLDQVALFNAYHQLKTTIKMDFFVSPYRPTQNFDDEDAVIWVVVNELKTQKNKYNDYKQQLLAKYGHFKVVVKNEPFNELVSAKYGRMLYNKHDQYIGQSIKHHGVWCEHEIDLLRRLIQSGQTVLDIGANIGTHSLAFCHLVGITGKVFAFEPQRLVYQTLVANMALNSIPNAYCYQKAVGKKNSRIQIPVLDYTKFNNFGALSLAADKMQHSNETEWVELITVDSLRLGACHLMKIDVEGMKKAVLKGAEKTIRRFKPVMYIENHDDENRQSLIALARSFNYRLYWHGTKNDPNMLCISRDSPISVQGLEEIVK